MHRNIRDIADCFHIGSEISEGQYRQNPGDLWLTAFQDLLTKYCKTLLLTLIR